MTSSLKYLDECFSDPRIHILNNSCAPQRDAIYVPYLNENPNHSLHEIIWVVSHLIQHCVRKHSLILIQEELDDDRNIQTCLSKSQRSTGKAEIKWGTCVIILLAAQLNIPVESVANFSSAIEHIRNNSSVCTKFIRIYANTRKPRKTDGLLIYDENFSYFSYYTRNCYPDIRCESTFIPLSESKKKGAMALIRKATRVKLRIRSREHTKRVKIVMYDRNDTHRRRWVHTRELVKSLRGDSRVELMFLQNNPDSFRQQVELFAETDIVISTQGAALANTVFMESDTDVIEVYGDNVENVRMKRYMIQRWTGEACQLLDINISYLECFLEYNISRTDVEEEFFKKGVETALPRYTKLNDTLFVLDAAIERQLMRVNNLAKIQTGDIMKSSPPIDISKHGLLKSLIFGYLFFVGLLILQRPSQKW